MHNSFTILGAVLHALCGAVTLIWMMRNLFVSIRKEGLPNPLRPAEYWRRSMEVLLRPFIFFMAFSLVNWLIFFGVPSLVSARSAS